MRRELLHTRWIKVDAFGIEDGEMLVVGRLVDEPAPPSHR